MIAGEDTVASTVMTTVDLQSNGKKDEHRRSRCSLCHGVEYSCTCVYVSLNPTAKLQLQRKKKKENAKQKLVKENPPSYFKKH